MRSIFAILTMLSFVLAAPRAEAGAELVMVEQHGCHYCETWDAEIGPIYDKTAEGRAAPLRRVDLHQKLPSDLSFKTRAVFTPTFVLVVDGTEVARLEGYSGEDFFWFLLAEMFKQGGVDPATSG